MEKSVRRKRGENQNVLEHTTCQLALFAARIKKTRFVYKEGSQIILFEDFRASENDAGSPREDPGEQMFGRRSGGGPPGASEQMFGIGGFASCGRRGRKETGNAD